MLKLFSRQQRLLRLLQQQRLPHLARSLGKLNAQQRQPLLPALLEQAVALGYGEALRLLLEAGADVDQPLAGQRSALFKALQQPTGLPLLLQMLPYSHTLLQQLPDILPIAFTTLDHNQQMLLLSRLQQYGMDLNQPDRHGITPFQHALGQDNQPLLIMLVQSGVPLPDPWPAAGDPALRTLLQRHADDRQLRHTFSG